MTKEERRALLAKEIKQLDNKIAWTQKKVAAERVRLSALEEKREALAEEYLALGNDTDPWS